MSDVVIKPGQLWRWKSSLSGCSRQTLTLVLCEVDMGPRRGKHWRVWDFWVWPETAVHATYGADVVSERELRRGEWWQLIADVPS